MRTEIFEIVPSVFVLRVSPSEEFCYNSFLIVDEHTMLIHTGRAKFFSQLQSLLGQIIDPRRLKYIGFSHFEADECGAINLLTDLCINAVPVVGAIGRASIEDISRVAPRCVEDGEKLELGRYCIEVLHTPHCPHGWDACMFYEDSNKVLFSSDLGAHPGSLVNVTFQDLSEVARLFQDKFGFLSIGPEFKMSLGRILEKKIDILATQHGAIVKGDAVRRLLEMYHELNSSDICANRAKVTCSDF